MWTGVGYIDITCEQEQCRHKVLCVEKCSLRAICTFSSLYSQYLLNAGVVMGLLVCCWSLHVCCGGMCSRLYWDGEAVFTSPHMVL